MKKALHPTVKAALACGTLSYFAVAIDSLDPERLDTLFEYLDTLNDRGVLHPKAYGKIVAEIDAEKLRKPDDSVTVSSVVINSSRMKPLIESTGFLEEYSAVLANKQKAAGILYLVGCGAVICVAVEL